MRDLQTLISEICTLLDNPALADSNSGRELAGEYAAACGKYNESARQYASFWNAGHVLDAELFSHKQTPPLFEQYSLLTFSRRSEWEDCVSDHQWECPPELEKTAASRFSEAPRKINDLNLLLKAYREVARTDEDLCKIFLLRQILRLDPKPEWRNVLRPMELKQQDHWISLAKSAILEHRYGQLKNILSRLEDDGWQSSPKESVLRKIHAVLDEAHKAEVAKRAVQYLDQVNNAYSSFDYSALGRSLRNWKSLIELEKFTPGDSEKIQVGEAQSWYEAQSRIKADDARFEVTLSALRRGLEKEVPVSELEILFNTLELLEREIPENLRKRYYDYRDSMEEIARRKKLLKVALVVFSGVVLLSLGIWGSFLLVRSSAEREWCARLEISLSQNTAQGALDLLTELKKKSPMLQKRPAILELEKRAQEKWKLEESRRVQFAALSKTVDAALANFSKNRTMLRNERARLLRLIVDEREQKIFAEIDRKYRIGEADYVQTQNETYMELLKKIRLARKNFFSALEKEDLAVAEAAILDSESARDEALRVPDVAEPLKNKFRKVFDDMSELREQFGTMREKLSRRDSMLREIDSAETLPALTRAVTQFTAQFGQDTRFEEVRNFAGGSLRQANAMSLNGEKAKALPTAFDSEACKALHKLFDSRSKLRTEMTKFFRTLTETYQTGARNAVILTDENESIMYDFYLMANEKVRRTQIDNDRTYRFSAICNEQCEPQKVKLFSGDGRFYAVNVNEKTISSCKLLFPASPQAPAVAPHVALIRDVSERLKSGQEEDTEKILCGAVADCLNQPYMNPFLKLQLCKLILNYLGTAFPENSDYADWNREIEQLFAGLPKDFNWVTSYEDPTRQQEYRDRVSVLATHKLRRQTDFRVKWLTAAISRKLIPVGVLRRGLDGNGLRLQRFREEVPLRGELWCWSENDNSFVVVGSFAGGRMTVEREFQKILRPWQIVYTPGDGRSTAALTREFLVERESTEIDRNFQIPGWPIQKKE